MMSSYRFSLSLLCLVLGTLYFVSEVSAQAPYRPPLSPWLNMFNKNPGPLGNYLGTVKPQLDMNKAMSELQRNQGAIQKALQTQPTLQNPPTSASSSPNQLLNDGSTQRILAEPRKVNSIGGNHGAGYNQYLHWYPGGGLPRSGVPYFSPAQSGARRY